MRESDGFTFRAKVECTRPIRYIIDLGLLAPFHAGAAGRAIMAGVSDDDLDEMGEVVIAAARDLSARLGY